MGTKKEPGIYDCYEKAEDDEPMFILLGRDREAPTLVRRWAKRAEAFGDDPAKVAEALDCAAEMQFFRHEREARRAREEYRKSRDMATEQARAAEQKQQLRKNDPDVS